MATTKWTFDPTHSELGFKIRHLMITNVSGSFKKFAVEVKTAGEDFTTVQIVVKADMDSIYTNSEQRDNHLRNADFFEVEKYPEMIFQSTRVQGLDSETYELYGDLTIKGITKPVKLNMEFNGLNKDPWGGERAGFVISGKINRADWGITFNGMLETGGLMLGEEVKIMSEIQLIKETEAVMA